MNTATASLGTAGDSEPAAPKDAGGVSEELRTLIERAKVEREAFGELYRRYREEVFAYIRRRVNDRQGAEDLTHDTFVRALRHIGGYEVRDHDIVVWLKAIAGNLIKDQLRSARHRLELPADGLLSFDTPTNDRAAQNPETVVMDHLTTDALREAVKKLKPDAYRTCIALRYLEGRGIKDTADAMGKSEAAIRTMTYKARQALARDLSATFEFAASNAAPSTCARPSPDAPSGHIHRSEPRRTNYERKPGILGGQIVRLLDEQPRPWRAYEVADKLQIGNATANNVMSVLAELGRLDRIPSGEYLRRSPDGGERLTLDVKISRSQAAPDTLVGRVLTLLGENSGRWRSRDVAAKLGIRSAQAGDVLTALVACGLLACPASGQYEAPDSDGCAAERAGTHRAGSRRASG